MNTENHIKTTLNMENALMREAKKLAAERKTTMTMIVQEALRAYLAPGEAEMETHFVLADGSFKGELGLQPGIDPTDWSQIRDAIYEGRGT